MREQSGLALSSRNVRLTPAGRERALVLSRAVAWAAATSRTVREVETEVTEMITRAGGDVAYANVVTNDTVVPFVGAGPARLLIAAQFDGVRLLDNGPVVVKEGM